jgi:hypothetical protein
MPADRTGGRLADNVLYYGDNLGIPRHDLKDQSADLVCLDPQFNSTPATTPWRGSSAEPHERDRMKCVGLRQEQPRAGSAQQCAKYAHGSAAHGAGSSPTG